MAAIADAHPCLGDGIIPLFHAYIVYDQNRKVGGGGKENIQRVLTQYHQGHGERSAGIKFSEIHQE